MEADVLAMGESPGMVEVIQGRPFVGPAGGMWARILRRNGLTRPQFRIGNLIQCRPPGDELGGKSWEMGAVAHCSQYREPLLNERHPVVMPLGAVPLRHLMGLDEIKITNAHGYVWREPMGRFWVVGSFHPSHLQQGAEKLVSAVSFDLAVALKVAQAERAGGFKLPPPPSLVIDPEPQWFARWVDDYVQRVGRGEEVWLTADVETPEKAKEDDEGELTGGGKIQPILRINFAHHPEEGITVPWEEPYITSARAALATEGVKVFWNYPFDGPVLAGHGVAVCGPIWDAMDAWHVLQSDHPRGLGYVTPFFQDGYSTYIPAWKHLGSGNPVYCAYDPVAQIRNMFGVARELQTEGMWHIFQRHMVELDAKVLRPAIEIGLKVDIVELDRFGADLTVKTAVLYKEIQELVPEHMKPLHPKGGWKRKPDTPEVEVELEEGFKVTRPVLEAVELCLVKKCLTCSATQITGKHRCKDPETGKPSKVLVADVQPMEEAVSRYYVRLDFNPESQPQVLAYVLAKGLKPGRAKKTRRPSVDRKALERLEAKDPLFARLKGRREIEKVKSTYVEGVRERLGQDGAIHTTFTHLPSMFRLSSRNPNVQNVVADKTNNPASGFKRCIVARSGCWLARHDSAAIEAVLTGWFARDPLTIRLAKLGIHAYVAGALKEVNQPADLSWSDEDLAEHFKELKKKFPIQYSTAKRCVYLAFYGGGPKTMVEHYPESFPAGIKDATITLNLLFDLLPKLKQYQLQCRMDAEKRHHLGGPHNGGCNLNCRDHHPHGYRHWFWAVTGYRRITPEQRRKREQAGLPVVVIEGTSYAVGHGRDSERAVAFNPQSAAGGILYDSCLDLMDQEGENYVGDLFHGFTPIRALIHDDILEELPDQKLEEGIYKTLAAMTRPLKEFPLPPEWGMGKYLSIGAVAEVGRNWKDMQEHTPTTGVAGDGMAVDEEVGAALG